MKSFRRQSWRVSLATIVALGWALLVESGEIVTKTAEAGDILIQSRSKDSLTQIKLGEFQIRLTPTPNPLTNIENILGPAIEDVAEEQLRAVFGDSFQYIFLAGVDLIIDDAGRRDLQTLEPSTVVHYKGAAVTFDDDPNQDIRPVLEAAVASSTLTDTLVTIGGAPWSTIQKVEFISLLPTLAPTQSPTDIDPAIVGSTRPIYKESGPSSSQRLLRILGGVFGGCFIVIACLLFAQTSRRIRDKKLMTAHALASAMDESEFPIDEDFYGQRSPTVQSVESLDDGIFSEMAHYAASSDSASPAIHRTDSGDTAGAYSVTSEWTMGTYEDSRATGGAFVPYRHEMEGPSMWASHETFERDKRIPLQKETLQSPWAKLPSGTGDRRLPLHHKTVQYTLGPSLQFAESHAKTHATRGHLVPPSRTSRTRRGVMT